MFAKKNAFRYEALKQEELRRKTASPQEGAEGETFRLLRTGRGPEIAVTFAKGDKRELVKKLIDVFSAPNAPKPDAFDFRKLDLSGVNCKGLPLRVLGSKALRSITFTNADLSGQNFSGLNLQRAKMQGVKAFRSRFDRANLMNAKMENSTISQSSFKGADARGIFLRNANAKDIVWNGNFDGARLERSVMDGGSFVDGSRFSSAHMLEAKLDACQTKSNIARFDHADMDAALQEAAPRIHMRRDSSFGKHALLRKMANEEQPFVPAPRAKPVWALQFNAA